MLAELEEQRRAVARRSEQLDRSRAALEQFRGELGQLHRETLEIRLATEELWVQLSGVAPPAALIQSLGGIRNKLAEHYRSAQSELRRERKRSSLSAPSCSSSMSNSPGRRVNSTRGRPRGWRRTRRRPPG